jgi:hypothetical protein
MNCHNCLRVFFRNPAIKVWKQSYQYGEFRNNRGCPCVIENVTKHPELKYRIEKYTDSRGDFDKGRYLIKIEKK